MRQVQEASCQAISVGEAMSRSEAQAEESAANVQEQLRSVKAQCAKAVEEAASEKRKVAQLQQMLFRTETQLSVYKRRNRPVRAVQARVHLQNQRVAAEVQMRDQQQQAQTRIREDSKLEDKHLCVETDAKSVARQCCGMPHALDSSQRQGARRKALLEDLGTQAEMNLKEDHQCAERETGATITSLHSPTERQAERDQVRQAERDHLSRLEQTLFRTETQLSVIKGEYSRAVLAQDQLRTVQAQCAKAVREASSATTKLLQAEARVEAAEAEFERIASDGSQQQQQWIVTAFLVCIVCVLVQVYLSSQ